MVWCRSSKAPDVEKRVYGSKVPVFSDEKLSMRVLVSLNDTLLLVLLAHHVFYATNLMNYILKHLFMQDAFRIYV